MTARTETPLFVVICEAAADREIASHLADRVFVDRISWLKSDPEWLPQSRNWCGEISLGGALTWGNIRQLSPRSDWQHHGHFDNEPGAPDAAAARRAIRFVLDQIEDVSAIVLIRDQDNEDERLRGLNQARAFFSDWPDLQIVVGLAVCEREAWVLAGFLHESDAEEERIELERQSLGFNPVTQSERLDAGANDKANKSPKRVLKALTAGDKDRERKCWEETPLDRLRENGQHNGLADYLQEVTDRLVPLIEGRSKSRPTGSN